MSEFKIFTFHTMTEGWRVEVYDINNKLVKVSKANDPDQARAIAGADNTDPSMRSRKRP